MLQLSVEAAGKQTGQLQAAVCGPSHFCHFHCQAFQPSDVMICETPLYYSATEAQKYSLSIRPCEYSS